MSNVTEIDPPINYRLNTYLAQLNKLVDLLEVANKLSNTRILRDKRIDSNLFQYDFFSIFFRENSFSIDIFLEENEKEKANIIAKNYLKMNITDGNFTISLGNKSYIAPIIVSINNGNYSILKVVIESLKELI